MHCAVPFLPSAGWLPYSISVDSHHSVIELSAILFASLTVPVDGH